MTVARKTRKRGQLPQQGESPVEGRVLFSDPGFELHVEVYGKPAPQGSKNQWGAEDNPNTKPWRERIARVAKQEGWVALDGALESDLAFVFDPPKKWDGVTPPTTKATYDTDKLIRAVHDGITAAGVWVDDARCSKVTAERFYVGQAGAPLREAGALLQVWVRELSVASG